MQSVALQQRQQYLPGGMEIDLIDALANVVMGASSGAYLLASCTTCAVPSTGTLQSTGKPGSFATGDRILQNQVGFQAGCSRPDQQLDCDVVRLYDPAPFGNSLCSSSLSPL